MKKKKSNIEFMSTHMISFTVTIHQNHELGFKKFPTYAIKFTLGKKKKKKKPFKLNNNIIFFFFFFFFSIFLLGHLFHKLAMSSPTSDKKLSELPSPMLGCPMNELPFVSI